MSAVHSALESAPASSQDRAMLTGSQIRAARALLRWTTTHLAKQSRVGVATIHRAEAVEDMPGMNTKTLRKIKDAFEAEGIEFLDGNYTGTGGPGVRLKS